MGEQALTLFSEMQTNSNEIILELNRLQGLRQDPKKKQDLDEFKNIILLLDKRIELAGRVIRSDDLKEAEVSKLAVDMAIKEFKAGKGRIELGRLSDAVIKYPMSLDKMATVFGYENGEALLKEIREMPIEVINRALLKFSIEWENAENQLKSLQTEGRMGDNAQRLASMFNEAEASIKGGMTEKEKNLFNAKKDILLYAKTLTNQDINAIATFLLILLTGKNFSDEIVDLKKEYDDKIAEIEKKQEEFEKNKKDNKKELEKLNEEVDKEKKRLEKETEELNEQAEKKSKTVEELNDQILQYNKTIAEMKPQIEELTKKHGKLLKDVEGLEFKKDVKAGKKKENPINDFEEAKEPYD